MGREARLKRERKGPKVPAWTPFEEVEVLPLQGTNVPIRHTGFQKCYKNSRYQVFLRVIRDTKFGDGFHLSIKRLDREALHDWRDLQRIKNELLGEEFEAIELYPKESRLVDGANQYHLWCFPEFEFTFGFHARMIANPDDTIFGAKQRPFEEPVKTTGIREILY